MIRKIRISIPLKDLRKGDLDSLERIQISKAKNDTKTKKIIYEGILEFLQKTINEKKGDSE